MSLRNSKNDKSGLTRQDFLSKLRREKFTSEPDKTNLQQYL